MTNTEDSKKQWKTSSGMHDYKKEDFTNHRSKYTYIDMVSISMRIGTVNLVNRAEANQKTNWHDEHKAVV
jgi:hypothetical protein